LTVAADLGRMAAEFERLSVAVEGEFPGNIELRDIPDENWRRIQLGQDLQRLGLAVAVLRQAIEQNGPENRLSGVIALNATSVLVYGDLVMDDIAKVRGAASYNDLLMTLDKGEPTPFRESVRKAWPLRVARNQLLVHRNPNHTGFMSIDPDGSVVLAQQPRTTEASDEVEAGLVTLQKLAGLTVSEDDDGALRKLSHAIFDRIEGFGQAERDELVGAFKTTGLHSPPFTVMLSSLLQAIEALGPPPEIRVVPARPRPPGGTLMRVLGAAKGSPVATRMGGRLLFIQYRVAPETGTDTEKLQK
jgi:hypothetical protein